MAPSQIEFEIREPTGLRLGTYDIFTIRQKIYTGDLQPRCEYLGDRGQWSPLASNPLFAEVIALLDNEGEVVPDGGPRTAPRIAGWSTTSPAGEPSSPRVTAVPAAAPKKKGLLGRFFGKK